MQKMKWKKHEKKRMWDRKIVREVTLIALLIWLTQRGNKNSEEACSCSISRTITSGYLSKADSALTSFDPKCPISFNQRYCEAFTEMHAFPSGFWWCSLIRVEWDEKQKLEQSWIQNPTKEKPHPTHYRES